MGVVIVGCGMAGRLHAAAYLAIPGVSVRAVVDVDPDGAGRAAEDWGLRGEDRWFVSLEAALLARPDVQLVDICAPPDLHRRLCLEALEAGRHVVVEKPMAQTLEEADSMIGAARARSLVLGQIFQNRFNRTPLRIRALLEEGMLGPIVRVSVYGSTIHAYDTLLWLFGDPARVTAEWPRTMPTPGAWTDWAALQYEHCWSALIRFSSGTVATLHSGQPNNSLPQLFPFQDDSAVIEIVGERLAMVFTIWGQRVQFRCGPGPDGRADREYQAAVQQRFETMLPGVGRGTPTGHQAALADIVDAIAASRAPAIDGSEGRRTVALMTAIYESARRGATVSLPVSPEGEAYARALRPIPD